MQNYLHFKKINWRTYFTFLVSVNALSLVVPWSIYAFGPWLFAGEENSGLFFVMAALWVVSVIFAAINVVSAVIYLITNKPKKQDTTTLSVVGLLLSCAYILFMTLLFGWR